MKKIRDARSKVEEKLVIEMFFKKELIPASHHKLLVDALFKTIIEKIKIDNNCKLDKVIEEMNSQLEEIIRLLPEADLASSLLSQLEAYYQPFIEKRFLSELDTTLVSIVNYFKSYKAQLEKSPLAEGFLQIDYDYSWSRKPDDRCSYAKASDIRYAFIHSFRDVIDINFSKPNQKQQKPPVLKVWNSKFLTTQPTSMSHAVAIENCFKSTLRPLLDSVLYRTGYQLGVRKLIFQLYRTSIKLALRMIAASEQASGTSKDSVKGVADSRFYLLSLDALQQVFLKQGLRNQLESYTSVYWTHRRKLLRSIRFHVSHRMSSILQTGLFGQDWMDFHRFSRAKKPGSPIDSVECEGLHVAWLSLSALIRDLVRDYLIRNIDPCLALLSCCYLYVDFFFEVYSIFSTTPVSVQRSELFVNDLKLCIGLLESVYFLFSNITATPQADGSTAYKVAWPQNGFVDAIEFVVLAKKLQLIKAHLKVLYKVLSLNNNNIDDLLKELQVGLYKNRKLLGSFPEIYRKAFDMLDFLAKENENIKDLMQEM